MSWNKFIENGDNHLQELEQEMITLLRQPGLTRAALTEKTVDIYFRYQVALSTKAALHRRESDDEIKDFLGKLPGE